jgi:hypothetical protein
VYYIVIQGIFHAFWYIKISIILHIRLVWEFFRTRVEPADVYRTRQDTQQTNTTMRFIIS